MKKTLQLILAPFSFLYGIGVSIYQGFYLSGFFKTLKFSIPVISVGNLTVGGTGKSPHIEYLIKLLKDYIPVAVLSRGYRRKTTGHILLTQTHTAVEVGDEPVQIKTKFPDVPFAVNSNRSIGIPKLLSQHPEVKTILLDDAYQHLEVTPGLNILLTEYANPYFQDYLLPSGRLREWRYGARRADIVIVTKCPNEPKEEEILTWRFKLKLNEKQLLFFSYLDYGTPYHLFNHDKIFKLNDGLDLMVISAIAQSSYLLEYLAPRVASVTDYNFEDHHYFTETELTHIFNKYNKISHSNKMLLTTEKDATRLRLHETFIRNQNLDIYVLPLNIDFYNKEMFDQTIKNFLLEFKI